MKLTKQLIVQIASIASEELRKEVSDMHWMCRDSASLLWYVFTQVMGCPNALYVCGTFHVDIEGNADRPGERDEEGKPVLYTSYEHYWLRINDRILDISAIQYNKWMKKRLPFVVYGTDKQLPMYEWDGGAFEEGERSYLDDPTEQRAIRRIKKFLKSIGYVRVA
jgi:hypothetical protein